VLKRNLLRCKAGPVRKVAKLIRQVVEYTEARAKLQVGWCRLTPPDPEFMQLTPRLVSALETIM
jgi:hypothetical protein